MAGDMLDWITEDNEGQLTERIAKFVIYQVKREKIIIYFREFTLLKKKTYFEGFNCTKKTAQE
jgi:hypothetical protein